MRVIRGNREGSSVAINDLQRLDQPIRLCEMGLGSSIWVIDGLPPSCLVDRVVCLMGLDLNCQFFLWWIRSWSWHCKLEWFFKSEQICSLILFFFSLFWLNLNLYLFYSIVKLNRLRKLNCDGCCVVFFVLLFMVLMVVVLVGERREETKEREIKRWLKIQPFFI